MSSLKRLLQQPDNRVCADCGAPDPKWASTTIGVFVCSKCCGVHRSLGVHISRVASVTLDEWPEEQVEVMEAIGGNASANAVYEACIPSGTRKPNANSSFEARSDYIRRKYEDQEFLKPTLKIKSASHSRSSAHMQVDSEPVRSTSNDSPPRSSGHTQVEYNPVRTMRSISSISKNSNPVPRSNNNNASISRESSVVSHSLKSEALSSNNLSFKSTSSLSSVSHQSGASLSRTNSNPSTAAKVEFLGTLKVKIVRGISLAVRDLLSSDPYVVATLGAQSKQTRVINRNLNPVWNEELTLSVPSPPQPLKVQVFDKDVFSADDSMGEAEVDLNPLILAAQMHQGMFEEFGCEQIGRWLSTSDNALIEDSNIEVIDGLIKQDVHLKLQNVERGELEVSLEWVPLPQ